MSQEQVTVHPEYHPLACLVCRGSDLETVYERPGYTLSTPTHKLSFDLRYQVCRDCGLVFMNPQLDQSCWNAYIQSAVFTVMRQQIDPVACARKLRPFESDCLDGFLQPGMRALEIGCGDGLLLYHLHHHYGSETFGIDLSETYCRYVREHLQLEVAHLAVEELAAPDGSYDLIVSKHVFEHLCDPLEALKKVRRLLKDDGLFLLEVPSVDAPLLSLRDMFAAHNVLFSPVTLRNTLARAGFRIEACVEGPELAYVLRKGAAGEPGDSDYARVGAFLQEEVRKYRSFYQGVSDRIETLLRRWRDTSARVAIFGSGEHTFSLLTEFDFSGCDIRYLLDSNRHLCGTRRYGCPIVHPDELAQLPVDDVLISSYAYQEQMAAQIAAMQLPVSIHTLYSDKGVGRSE